MTDKRSLGWVAIRSFLPLCLAILALRGNYSSDEFMAILLIVLIVGVPHDSQLRRGKEILNRYSPERNPRPLGL
jgi:hypothetical protein